MVSFPIMRVCLLLGVQLDDQVLFYREIYILTGGHLGDSALEGVLLAHEPLGRSDDGGVLGEEALEPATQEALDAEVALIGEWMDQWKARDCDGFALSYDKEAIINSGDELNSRLFTDRDPGMIQYAADYLSQDGQHTGLMVVGAGHMIGDTGIVQGLIDLGYDVHVVPVP